MKFLNHTLIFFGMVGFASSAMAGNFANFNCEAGDINYAVTMTEPFAPFVTVKVSVGEQMNQNLNRTFALNRTDKTGGAAMAYSGTDRVDGLVVFSASSPETVKIKFADGNSLSCASADAADDVNGNSGQDINGMADMQERMKRSSEMSKLSPLNAVGYSLGGKMRSQPSKDYNSVAKIRRGNRLQIIGRTAMTDNGYTWYKVRTDGGKIGFMWGGELCYAYERRTGLYGSCRTQGIDVANMWMVIAVNTQKGHGRQGVDIDRNRAQQKAMRSCGRNCKIIDEGQPLCHAYAASRKAGYFDGTAQGTTLSDVRRRARDNCEIHAALKGTCKIKFASCQSY